MSYQHVHQGPHPTPGYNRPPGDYPPPPPPPGYGYPPPPPPPGPPSYQGYFNNDYPPPLPPQQHTHQHENSSGCCSFLKGCADSVGSS
ncbi:Hypothetical predicted protein [Olea europaea subsp. europaea]|uniref:Uncharacterized protein n=1 Tax=Olea europaea subsp. europaea TaxID=158383 RepID=A0A8S0UVA2_OLEEU|nr:Hypothetical predicted protein [Olea europaea subsp. europaea]